MSENQLSRRVLEEENRRAGRVIPAWRLYLAFIATALVWDVYGRLAGGLPWWCQIIAGAVSAIIFAALLSRYKKRSVS